MHRKQRNRQGSYKKAVPVCNLKPQHLTSSITANPRKSPDSIHKLKKKEKRKKKKKGGIK